MSPSVEPFDEAKYKALMDGLECSEISLSTVFEYESFRIDSHFFEKQYSDLKRTIGMLPCEILRNLVAKHISMQAHDRKNAAAFSNKLSECFIAGVVKAPLRKDNRHASTGLKEVQIALNK